jgi:hypothetical protein
MQRGLHLDIRPDRFLGDLSRVAEEIDRILEWIERQTQGFPDPRGQR